MLDKINDYIDEPLPRKILFFDEMLTPSLIQIAYWLSLLAVAWIGLEKLFSNGFFGIFEAVVFVLISGIGLRVLFELIMLFFKLHENMEILTKNSEAAAKVAASPVSPSGSRKMVSKKASKKATARKISKKTGKKV